MYNNNEIEIIFDSCENLYEYYLVCLAFKYLKEENYIKKTGYLYVKCQQRFRELEKL